MDIDDVLETLPSAEDVWNMLWDSENDDTKPAIRFESKLVDDLLIAAKTESVEQDCPGFCDACMEVSRLIDPNRTAGIAA
jgi:hypothetical protein